MHAWPAKDPEEVLDYQYDWTARLVAGETIIAATTTIMRGTVTKDSETFAPEGVVTIWLSGGTAGEVCLVQNHIETSAGREYEETARLRVRTK